MTVAECLPEFDEALLRPAWEEVLVSVSEMSSRAFHRFEFDLVSRYRANEAVQESISIALQRAIASCREASTLERLEEIALMLEHVHDPLI